MGQRPLPPAPRLSLLLCSASFGTGKLPVAAHGCRGRPALRIEEDVGPRVPRWQRVQAEERVPSERRRRSSVVAGERR